MNIHPNKILYHGPRGWDYHLWSTYIGEHSVDGWTDQLDIRALLDQSKLDHADKIELGKQFMLVVSTLSIKYHFTHFLDAENLSNVLIIDYLKEMWNSFDNHPKLLEGMNEEIKAQIVAATVSSKL